MNTSTHSTDAIGCGSNCARSRERSGRLECSEMPPFATRWRSGRRGAASIRRLTENERALEMSEGTRELCGHRSRGIIEGRRDSERARYTDGF